MSTGRRLVVLVLVGASLPAARGQIVQGRVDTVGFQTESAPVLREGQWFPILVTLQTQGSQVFTGTLRVEGVDLDGDRIAFSQPQVSVAGEGGTGRRVWCYAVANATNELPDGVEVVDEQTGERVAEMPLPAAPLRTILHDDLLVLDVSIPRVTALSNLQTPSWSPGQGTDGSRPFYRNIVVAHMPPTDLPDRWWGLEAVDVLIWDTPDPAILSVAQRDALIEWVWTGGQFVVGLGVSWGALSKSEFAALLPLAGEGATQTVSKLPMLFDQMAPDTWKSRVFRDPVPLTTAGLTTDAVRTLADFGPGGQPVNLISMRPVGSGRVVATAASLRDLTSVPIGFVRFFEELIDLNAYTEEFKERQNDSAVYANLNAAWVYDEVVRPIAFVAATALRGLTALVFVAGYVLAGTLASWWWLRRRSLTHLSWTVFAGFAVTASALSLATVSVSRGLVATLHSASILDLEAGARTARGYCLFGYRSPVRQRAEFTLPGEGNFLRPLARNPQRADKFVTPARYASVPTQSGLEDMLIRATLKQMEGFWQGELEGSIRGNLVTDRATGRLTPGSWLANDLSVGIESGYLLYIDPRQDDGAGGVPWRAAGLATPHPLPEGVDVKADLRVVPPAVNILAARVPRIPAGQQISGIGQADYASVDENWGVYLRTAARKQSEVWARGADLPTLWQQQQAWGGNVAFASLRPDIGGPVQSVFLLSTRNYYLHNAGGDFNRLGTPLRSDGVPDLDVTHWLMRGQAVLLCWANDPGPARLHRNSRPLEPDRGQTVYRVRLPLQYEGTPPHGETAP